MRHKASLWSSCVCQHSVGIINCNVDSKSLMLNAGFYEVQKNTQQVSFMLVRVRVLRRVFTSDSIKLSGRTISNCNIPDNSACARPFHFLGWDRHLQHACILLFYFPKLQVYNNTDLYFVLHELSVPQLFFEIASLSLMYSRTNRVSGVLIFTYNRIWCLVRNIFFPGSWLVLWIFCVQF